MPRSTKNHIWKYRHRRYWDLTSIPSKAHRDVVQGALNATDFPFSRIRKLHGVRVPVGVRDLSRYNEALSAADGHLHIENDDGEKGHILGAPAEGEGFRAHDDHDDAGDQPDVRFAALGLYWLPTAKHPAGRVELEISIMDNVPLAQEVFLAEAAHAVDYGCMSGEDRVKVLALFHDNGHAPHGASGLHPDDWFEGHDSSYWGWPGERFMGLFMAAFAPSLPRPLENRQPWTHHYDETDVARAREILLHD